MSYIVPLDKPKCCLECPFCGDKQYDPVGNGLYERIGRCVIAPEYDEETGEEIDTYRNVNWLSKNTFDWCPLKECKDEGEEEKIKTVGDLIKALQELPKDAPITYDDLPYGYRTRILNKKEEN